MTDFASLLVADRGQKAHRSTSSTRTASTLGENPPGRRSRRCSKAHRFDGKSGFAFVILPRKAASSKWFAAVADAGDCRPGALRSSARACPKAHTKLADGEPGRRRSAGCSPSTASTLPSKKRRARSRARACWLRAKPAKIDPIVREAEAMALVRDLVEHARRRPRPGRARTGRARPGRADRQPKSGSRPATSSTKAIR